MKVTVALPSKRYYWFLIIMVAIICAIQVYDIWSVNETLRQAERLRKATADLEREVNRLDKTLDRFVDAGE